MSHDGPGTVSMANKGDLKSNVENPEIYILSFSLILFNLAGSDTSSSQFYIALVLPQYIPHRLYFVLVVQSSDISISSLIHIKDKLDWLDGENVVVGRVRNKVNESHSVNNLRVFTQMICF
jgi:cyclophilin family peptidyl-prolyl cis-trans isomerase